MNASFEIDTYRMFLRIPLRVAAVFAMLGLSACSTNSNPIMQTLKHVVKREGVTASTRFDPNFSYMRVVVGGRITFLALGNQDVESDGTVEVWYSAGREVLRFRDGRLVEAVGLTTEWRHVSFPERVPSWDALAHAAQPIRLTRIRDVMPGYRYGITDALILRETPPPPKNNLQGVDQTALTWFEERIDTHQAGSGFSGAGGVADTLAPARYAVDFRGGKGVVVYGELCLAADLCFSWQRWPAALPTKMGS